MASDRGDTRKPFTPVRPASLSSPRHCSSRAIKQMTTAISPHVRGARSPQVKFHSHRKTHNTIIADERWYGKGPPFLGKSFTAKKAVKRHGQISKILGRAAKREHK